MKKIMWQIRNLTLFLTSLFHIAIFGKRQDVPQQPKTIAIIQGAKLGDMVCTTPLFRAIKQSFPQCRLIVIGDEVNQKLLEHHPAVDQYVTLQGNFFETVHTLRDLKIDYGCVALPSLESLAILICARTTAVAAPIITGGTSPYETRTYRLLRRFVISVPNHFGSYIPREYLRLLEPLNIFTEDTTKWLSFSAQAKAVVEKFLTTLHINPQRELLVGITPAVGGNKRKRWAAQKFAQVADYLAHTFKARIIVIGSGRDKTDIETMLNAMRPETNAINTLDQFTLDELKALISNLSLFISADTGPIYIAEAFKIPTIDIVGPMDETVQPPRGKMNRVVVPPRKQPAFGILDHFGINPDEELRQSAATTVEMVTNVIDELLNDLKKSPTTKERR